MKKILNIITILTASMLTTFAWDPHNSAQQDIVVATSDSKLGLWFDIKVDMQAKYVTKVKDNSVSSFGYYTMDSNFNVISKKLLSKSGGIITASAGEVLGFWYEKNGDTFSSILKLNTEPGWYFGGREVDNNGRWFWFEEGTKGKKLIGIKIYEPGMKQPSGQPLPGVFATFLLACPIALYFFKKSKK